MTRAGANSKREDGAITRAKAACPHCGRPYAPRLKVRGYVAQRLVNVIAEHADTLTIKQLVDLVYADDPNGGPLSAQRSLNVIAHHIKATHRGAGARYELVPLEKRIRGTAA